MDEIMTTTNEQEKLPHKRAQVKDMIDSLVYDKDLMDRYKWGIVQNIHAEILRQNVSVYTLAEQAGIHYSHLYNILKGKNRMGLDILIKTSYALGCVPSDFFPEEITSAQTDGDRFNEITRDMDLMSRNWLLDFCISYAKERKRLKNPNSKRAENVTS